MKVIALILLLITISACLEYDLELSKKLQAYGVVTHCSQKSLEEWSCRLCG